MTGLSQRTCGNPYCNRAAEHRVQLYDRMVIYVCEREKDRYEDMIIAVDNEIDDHTIKESD